MEALSNKQILDRDLVEYTKEQKQSLVIDFDQAVAEERADAIAVTFEGKTYELPKSAPAWLPLFINRHSGDGNELNDKQNLEMIENLLGKDFAQKIVDEKNNFVSFELVNNVILKPVMERWGFNNFEDTTEKK